MKTKLFTIAIVAIAIALPLTGCGGDDKTEHVHQWAWVTTTPATPDADGEETETCTICGQTNGTKVIPKITCHCPEGTTHEPDEKCCEGTDCTCEIAEPATREFLNVVMFAHENDPTDVRYANIVDARTEAGSKTLEQILDANNKNIVERIQAAVAENYKNASGLAGNALKGRYRFVFGNAAGENGGILKVVITIENNTKDGTDGTGTDGYDNYKVGTDFNDLRFSFEYLTDPDTTDADLQAKINSAISEMYAIYDTLS